MIEALSLPSEQVRSKARRRQPECRPAERRGGRRHSGCRLRASLRTGASILLCAASITLGPRADAAELHLSSGGDDTNPGSIEQPVATLTRARDLVRNLKTANPREDLTVLIHGGMYRLTDTVVFSLDDSGGEEQKITYAAAPGETPVFSGGVPVTGWAKPDQPIAGLPEIAQGQVWVADVSFVRDLKFRQAPSPTVATQFDRGWRFHTLYEGDRRLPRAKGPGFNQTKSIPRGTPDDRRTVHFPSEVVREWPDLQQAELAIIPSYFWISNILPLESVDEENGLAKTAVPGTYPLGKNGITDRPTAWVENVLEVLDEPGEWVLDSENAKLYLWPEGDEPGDGIVVPVLTELLRVEGKTDYDSATDTPVRNLVFRGLTFTQGDRFPWHGGTGWGLQHDWERFDSPTALVRLRGAEDCAVEECHFVNAGSTGIRLDLHCQKNRVVGNHLEHLGGVGILLAGYGPGTKDVNRGNKVTNNYVHHTGELYWGSPAIFAWQSGENRIAQNHLHNIPYTGICVTGRISWHPKGLGECSRTVRWHELGIDPEKGVPRLSWQEREKYLHGRNNLIERNDIHNAMEVTGDGNCIYVSGTGGGNHVKENYCHDCDGKYMNAVIRCDDDQHGTVMEGNVICRTRGHAEGFISKGDNDIINNFIIDLRPNHPHRGYLVFPYGSLKGSTIQRNVLYSRQKGQTVCYEGGARGNSPPPRLRDTDADYNVYFCSEDPAWGERHVTEQREFGIEEHSISADPLFVNVDGDDFRLKPESPALKLGIKQPVSLDEVGLQSPYRERLIGRRLTTTIEPPGGVLRQPVEVTLATDTKDAEIRYTLDGSDPTRRSSLYERPFTLAGAAIVRAKAFAERATDLTGATAEFIGPPKPIVEDFESCRVGEPTPGAETSEEGTPPVAAGAQPADRQRPPRAGARSYVARVSDEQALSGKHSLKFIDGPGQKYPFNPHVYYRLNHREGQVLGRFAVYVDDATSLYYQWRQYSGGTYHRGPDVQISPGGKVTGGGRELVTIPSATWVQFEVMCELGTGAWTLQVSVPGKETKLFPDLTHSADFERLDWVGFVANGERATVFYVDDVELRAVGATTQ